MTVTSVALKSVGAVAVGLFLVRKWVSRKWGVCTLKTKLNGKVVIVTGGNVGLGAEAAMDFAKRGATVILACRSWENTKDTLHRIRTKSGNNDVHYLHLDLGSLESVRQFAEDVQAKYPEIHTLVCNAGVWFPMEKKIMTSDGFEVHAGVNHLGHHLLTSLLLDRLAMSAPARVVVVSSGLSEFGKLDFEKFDHFKEGRPKPDEPLPADAPTGYCDSKTMNVLFAKELSVKASGRGVTTVSLCPGLCNTSIFRNSDASLIKSILFLPFVLLNMRSAASGAQNIIQAAVEDEDNLVNGGYYRECKLAEANAKMDDLSEIGQQLWEISENLTGLK